MQQGGTHIKHIDGKWRIMNADGSAILHAGNKPGNAPADGGGFDTYEEALKQFRAIEFSKHGG